MEGVCECWVKTVKTHTMSELNLFIRSDLRFNSLFLLRIRATHRRPPVKLPCKLSQQPKENLLHVNVEHGEQGRKTSTLLCRLTGVEAPGRGKEGTDCSQ